MTPPARFLPSLLRARNLGPWSLVAALMLAPAAFAEPAAITHVARNGDNLYDLSLKYLDDPLLWPALGKVNGISNPYRLPIGFPVEIPLELLRSKAGGANVVHISGTVTRSREGQTGSALALGERVVDGDIIETAHNGFVTLKLADGSHVRVAGDSVVQMQQLKYVVRRKRSDTVIEMERGRVESTVAPQAGGNRFRIRSPLMAAGVRGTHFGVTVTETGAVTSDVQEGSVQVSALTSASSVRVGAGQGTVAVTSSRVAQPSRLLPAPNTTAIPPLHQKPLLDLTVPAIPGAHAYRVYVARDQAMLQVVANVTTDRPRVRIPDLEDGQYFVSMRAITEAGIEGQAALRQLELDARPLPPMTLAPEHGAEQAEGDVVLRWTRQADVTGYELELARDEKFTQTLIERKALSISETAVSDLASGTYYWRVRAVVQDAAGATDRGPFGDPRRFAVRKSLAVTPSQEGENLRLRWEGEPGQHFLLQVSDEPAFASPVVELRTREREANLGALPGGEYYLRVQITDPDGYVRPFSPPQQFRAQSFMRTNDGELVRTVDGAPLERGG